MKVFRALKIIILFGYFNFSNADDRPSNFDFSLVHFQDLLYSEVNSVIGQSYNESSTTNDPMIQGRFLRVEDVTQQAEDLWNSIVQHGWKMTQSSIKIHPALHVHQNRRLATTTSDDDAMLNAFYPFIVCSASSSGTKSGFERLENVLRVSGAFMEDHVTVRNDPHKTCYHISMQHEVAERLKKLSRQLKMITMTKSL